jgi:thymidylate synthase (FAD)
MKLKVLDKGYVELIDHMGDDLRVVEAARISFNALPYADERDTKLINYLVRNGHTSPLEQVVFTFAIKLPIFVMRQLVRHRTARLNEASGRYSLLSSDFYTPLPSSMRTQGKANKQGSDEPLSEGIAYEMISDITDHCKESYDLYEKMLSLGLSREMARIVLPLNLYTEIVWQMDLNNLLKFLDQRLHPHAQWEIQQYAKAIKELIRPIVPICLSAWENKKTPENG